MPPDTSLRVSPVPILHSRNVVSAMKSAHSVLQLKEGVICVEIHAHEGSTSSTYSGKPLAAISTDDLALASDQAS